MADHLNGLRFDIYERVYLSDEVAGIEELEEIELVPHMQALTQEDQVLLRGHLLLSGVYRPQETNEVMQLEHWIPVEITLPLNRIQNVEELAVEIDNFDVDLLSNRSLNVTGVLALRGLQVQAPQEPIWRDDSFTVVHQTESEPLLSNTHNESLIEKSEADEPERVDDWSLHSETEELPVEATKESSWLAMFQNLEESRKDSLPEAKPEPVLKLESEPEPEPEPELVLESELTEASANHAPLVESQWGDILIKRNVEESPSVQAAESLPLLEEALEPSELETFEEDKNEILEEKQELKVALGGKPLEAANVLQLSGVGLLSQLGDKGAKREADLKLQVAAQAEEKKHPAAQSAATTGDELEWTRLFLNNESNAQSFRKVRMCIVQREETLELIANRYNVLPRELQLYNRLHDPYLSEGQVIYIP